MNKPDESYDDNAILRACIARLNRGEHLRTKEVKQAVALLMDGKADPVAFGAFLMGLNQVHIDGQALVGGVEAMRERMIPVEAPKDAFDIVGTGGDGKHTLNVSTAAALLLAACGVTVAKHGNRAVSSRAGASDTLAALGFDLSADKPVVEHALAHHGFAFLMAPNFHGALHFATPIRASLGIPTLFNILGPLANPASTRFMLVGVHSPELLTPYAEALQNLGVSRAWVVHGAGGVDELSLAGKNRIVSVRPTGLKHIELGPEDVDMPSHPIETLKGGDAEANGTAIRDLFDGKASPFRDVVVFNTGAALKLAGKAQRIEEGISMASAAIDQGAARKLLEALTA